MKIFIDDGNIEHIKELYDIFPVDGVSTNPSILAKEGESPNNVLRKIRDFIDDDELFVQVTSEESSAMVSEAKKIYDFHGKHTTIKVPCVKEGYKAMKILKKEKIPFIGTAIYAPMQGLTAAKCGAKYVAPYVNRIDNMGYDGISVAKEIHDAIQASGYTNSGVLAASFKNLRQVMELSLHGIKAVTLPYDIFMALLKNESVDSAVKKFNDDYALLMEQTSNQ